MASLATLRAEVLAGDDRPLFLGWLAGVQQAGPEGGEDDDRSLPPVPAGLAELTASQQSLADFLRLDADLLSAAAADADG